MKAEIRRGSALGTKFLLIFYRFFGYGAVRLALHPVVFYYTLTTRRQKQTLSKLYAILEKPFNAAVYYKHIHSFAVSILDRFIARIDPDAFCFEIEGLETFMGLKETGGVLLLAHMGGWGNMAYAFKKPGFIINAVMQENIGEDLAAVEDKTAGQDQRPVRFIDMSEGPLAVAVKIGNALLNKELVAMMADRAISQERTLRVPFLKKRLPLNKSPFEIAYQRKSPLVSLFITQKSPGCYDVRLEKIAVDYSLNKEEAIALSALTYGASLEHVLRTQTDQWFNFDNTMESA